MIIDVQDYTKMEILGTTLDDAAGECFDKVGRVLGMPYPGGAALDKLAYEGDPKAIKFPSPALLGDNLEGRKEFAVKYRKSYRHHQMR